MPGKGKNKRGGKNKTKSSPQNKNKSQGPKNRKRNENDDVGQQSKADESYFSPHDSGEISSKKKNRGKKKEKQKHDSNHEQHSFGNMKKNDKNEVTIHK